MKNTVSVVTGVGLSEIDNTEEFKNPFFPHTLYFTGDLADTDNLDDFNIIDLCTVEDSQIEFNIIDLGDFDDCGE
jgi:hypothetical protein